MYKTTQQLVKTFTIKSRISIALYLAVNGCLIWFVDAPFNLYFSIVSFFIEWLFIHSMGVDMKLTKQKQEIDELKSIVELQGDLLTRQLEEHNKTGEP